MSIPDRRTFPASVLGWRVRERAKEAEREREEQAQKNKENEREAAGHGVLRGQDENSYKYPGVSRSASRGTVQPYIILYHLCMVSESWVWKQRACNKQYH